MSHTMSRSLHVSEFRRVHTDGPFRVIVSIGDRHSVSVDGQSDDLDRIVARVAVRTLSLKASRPLSGEVTVHVTTPRLERVCVAGPGHAEVTLVKQNAIDLVSDAKATGDILVRGGDVSFIDASVLGAGNILAKALAAREGILINQGSGHIESTLLYSVNAKIKGAGDVRVWGEPKVCDVIKTGDGKFEVR